MGFLNDLKDIGFGNTGTQGRMRSGATNYANYKRERNRLESDRGVTQALAMAAKDGAEIPFSRQAEIAEQWGVPLNNIIQRTKVINEGLFATKAKKKLHTAAQIYMSDKKENPDLVADEKYLMKLFAKAKINNPRIMDMAQKAVVKLKDKSKTVVTGPYDNVLNITGNKVNVLREGQKKPATTKKNTDLVTGWNDYKKATGKNITLAKFKTDEWEKGKGGTENKSKAELESDIRSLAQKITGLQVGENLFESAMKSEVGTAALKGAQKQLKRMVAVYEKQYGVGSAMRLGFDTSEDTMNRKEAIKVLEDANKPVTEANIKHVMGSM